MFKSLLQYYLVYLFPVQANVEPRTESLCWVKQVG